jgi:hypothetical protein
VVNCNTKKEYAELHKFYSDYEFKFAESFKAIRYIHPFTHMKGRKKNPHPTNKGSMFSPLAKEIFGINSISCGVVERYNLSI